MSKNNTSSNSAGMGLVGWLTILFIGLKLTGYITWSWVWVLSPLWISFLVVIFIFLVVIFIFLILVIAAAMR